MKLKLLYEIIFKVCYNLPQVLTVGDKNIHVVCCSIAFVQVYLNHSSVLSCPPAGVQSHTSACGILPCREKKTKKTKTGFHASVATVTFVLL